MRLSNTVKENEPQLVRKIFDKAKQYDHVTDLTLGDPDIPTPEAVKNATIQALAENKTKYTANAGIPELRQAISDDVFARTGIRYPIEQIAVTAGAMGALYLTTTCLLNPGDEMIILEPHWPNYTNMVKMAGGVPRYVNYLGENLRHLEENIEKAVSEHTRAIIINSPSNPTGVILPYEKLEGIAQIAKKHDLYVITDEVYRTIVFNGSFHSILEIPGMAERTVLVDSLSKRFSMTGYRVGFVCGPGQLASSVAMLQENVNSCACQFAQYASLTALNHSHELEQQVCDIFRRRCTAMAAELNKSEKLMLPEPVSTFYLFVDIRKTGLRSEDFAYRLLDEKHIAVVPGIAFNKAGEGYIRIACTLSEEKLIAAAKDIVAFVEDL